MEEQPDLKAMMQIMVDEDRKFREKYPMYGKKIVEHDGQLYYYDPKEFEYKIKGPIDMGDDS